MLNFLPGNIVSLTVLNQANTGELRIGNTSIQPPNRL